MYIRFKLIAAVLLLLLRIAPAIGQESKYVVHVDHYSAAEGTGGNHAYDCFQDSRGIMWVVWEGSLDRFDGKQFKSFPFPQLKVASEVKILMEDNENDLWIWLSNKTIIFLNIYTEKLRTSAEKFGPDFPAKVDWAVKGIDDSYLLQDEASNIYRYRKGQKPALYYSAPGQLVSPLVEYEDGTAWLERNNYSKGGAMIATDRNGKEIINIEYQVSNIFAKGIWGKDTIHYITADSFFLATFKGIVLRRSLKSMYSGYAFSDPYATGRFQKISVEQDRNLVWVYLPYHVLVYDKSLKLLYEFDNPKYTFQSTDVYDIFLDNQNHTWLCTFGGLYNVNFKRNPFQWFLVKDPEIASPQDLKSTRKICKGADGNIYVLAAPELYRIKPDGQTTALQQLPEADQHAILSIEADNAGNLWFVNHQMYSYNVFSGKITTYPVKVNDNWFIKKYDNKLWLGYPVLALSVADGQLPDVKIYPQFGDLNDVDVYDFVKKGEREYWLATDKGLLLFDPETGTTERYWQEGKGKYFLPVVNIRHLYIDKAGDFWMAAREGLLYWKYSTGEYRLFGEAEGIKGNCSAVLEDDFGRLWVSSDYGLIQFDKATKRVRTFLITDGLPSDEFNRLSYFKDEETGYMYLGGLNGLVKFHPRDFQEQFSGVESIANLVLTECLLFSGKTNKEEDIRDKVLKDNLITINPGDLFLKIKFALTDYTKPIDITYSYLIEGYNNNWHTGRENELLLSGLPYGSYTLRVKAVSPNGLPYEKEMRIPIRVWPPFYLQTWFLVPVVLLLALAIAWYIRRRTTLLKERTTELEAVVLERTEVIENQRKTLKQLYDSKSRLYANITHEFRTPLTLIIGPAEQALKSAAEIGHGEIEKNLNYILENSGQLLGLVNQMLDLNKLESGVMKTEYYQGDIMGFLGGLVEKFRHYADFRGVSIAFHTDPASFMMDFDGELTEKIINNLMSNAVKFTTDGGSIHFKATVTDDRLAVVVKDTGSGISPEQLPFIFDRYYQADNSAARRSEGTGIGLALVKELVELLGGSIGAESEPGRGATFTLTLPVRRQSPLRQETQLSAATGRIYPAPIVATAPLNRAIQDTESEQQPTVIIVEDNHSMAGFITSCLSGIYSVQAYTESRRGLAAVQEHLPDLVICDLMMPDMDGYELCTILKTDERTSHIPVVFLSAVTEQSERLKRLNAGADAYVSKPFNAVELQAVAVQLLQSRTMLRERYLALSSDAENTGSKDGQPVETLNQFDIEFIRKVKTIILEHLAETEFDGNLLARMLGFSTSQLHRKLTALTGLPAGRYIYQIRLEKARDLLHQKDLTVTEIAYQTGFSDPAYFTKLFTRTFGSSPRNYRSSVTQSSGSSPNSA